MSPSAPKKKSSALAGHRITSQRRLLLDLIRKEGGHLDADQLYNLARQREPRISLSTVYRSLRLFKRLGIVDERHFTEEHHHYEVRGGKHWHLLCLNCGQVEEYDSPLTRRILKEVSQTLNFEAVGGEFHLSGYCSRCRSQNA